MTISRPARSVVLVMTVWLSPDDIASRLGIARRTAMTMMMSMNPVAISGSVRKRYRVSEESFNAYMIKHCIGGKAPVSRTTGTKRKLERR